MTDDNLRQLIGRDELVFDLETDSLNVHNAFLKFFGAYSFKYNEFYCIPGNDRIKIQELLSQHRVLIGHNIKDFDLPILKNVINRYDVEFKVLVDTLQIARKKLN